MFKKTKVPDVRQRWAGTTPFSGQVFQPQVTFWKVPESGGYGCRLQVILRNRHFIVLANDAEGTYVPITDIPSEIIEYLAAMIDAGMPLTAPGDDPVPDQVSEKSASEFAVEKVTSSHIRDIERKICNALYIEDALIIAAKSQITGLRKIIHARVDSLTGMLLAYSVLRDEDKP